jgi:hypothetical protein
MIALALATLLTCPAPQDELDQLTLTNGKVVSCRVLFENDERVVYRSKRRDREVERGEVAEVQSVERSMREFLERCAATDLGTVDGCTGMALFAEENFLFGEARGMWIRILTLDPDNGGAWTKLGGVHGRDGWRLRVRGRHLSLEDLRERAGTWRDAMELPTAHFLVRTNVQPEIALDIALDAERIYQAYYDTLGRALELYLFDEAPEINIYADVRDYPSPPAPGQLVWYQTLSNILHVNASGDMNRHEVMRRMTDVMIFNSFRRTVGGRTGSISSWAREGLSQTFASAFRSDPGRASFEFEAPLVSFFAAQAEDEEPLPLKRILSAGFGSFESGTHVDRFVREAYTLTHFMLFAQDGKYRVGFGEFLLSSYKGQGSATHLRRALDVDLKDLETQWVAYVAAVAGK